MNYKNIIVFDFETGGKDPHTCEIIQIAAVHIHPRRLTIGERFESLVQPMNMDGLEQEALEINKKTKEELLLAPHADVVWKEFAKFCYKFNKSTGPKKSSYNAPVPCGYNIRGYDMILVERYAQLFKTTDSKSGKQNLFNGFDIIDLVDDIFRWTENSDVIENKKLSTVRQWLGLSDENAHDAMQDTIDVARIVVKFMGLYRHMFPKIPFKNAFNETKEVQV